jgi:uncharacterized protein
MKFEWDEQKAASNLSKEERYLMIGKSNQGRLLITSYTERGSSIRLISARVVTRSEREVYEEG